jgi:hypothetical protein
LKVLDLERRLNNFANQISALATAIHQSYLHTLLEPYLLCRETPLMRPFKFELILGAKVSPRVAIRSKWALARSIRARRVDAYCRLLTSPSAVRSAERSVFSLIKSGLNSDRSIREDRLIDDHKKFTTFFPLRIIAKSDAHFLFFFRIGFRVQTIPDMQDLYFCLINITILSFNFELSTLVLIS